MSSPAKVAAAPALPEAVIVASQVSADCAACIDDDCSADPFNVRTRSSVIRELLERHYARRIAARRRKAAAIAA